MMKKKKYGLKFDKQKPEDYVFGASLPIEILQPDGNWQDYLPVKEFQNLNGIEPYACVVFTVLNCVETLIKRQYGEERNYSDRFLATVVDTSNGGTSPQEACEFLRKIGVVPEEVWPFDASINTSQKFFAKLPPKLYELANEFNKEWDFRHEYVPSNHEAISQALKCSPLLISVTAWYEKGGVYIRPKGGVDNHATTLFMERQGEWMRVFDSYDRPHIKDVAWDAVPLVVKRFWIKKRTEVVKKVDLLTKLLNAFLSLVGLMKEQGITELPKATTVTLQPQPEPVKYSVEILCAAIRDYEGYFPNSRSFRNKNPGNVKYSSVGYASIYGEVRKDLQGFAIFKDYETGWLYLKNLIRQKAKANPTWTLTRMVEWYAPSSDNNDVEAYSNYLARRLDVDKRLFTLSQIV